MLDGVDALTPKFSCVFGSLKPQNCNILPLCTPGGTKKVCLFFLDFQPLHLVHNPIWKYYSNFNRWMFTICEIITFKVTSKKLLSFVQEGLPSWCKGGLDDCYPKIFAHIFFYVGN